MAIREVRVTPVRKKEEEKPEPIFVERSEIKYVTVVPARDFGPVSIAKQWYIFKKDVPIKIPVNVEKVLRKDKSKLYL